MLRSQDKIQRALRRVIVWITIFMKHRGKVPLASEILHVMEEQEAARLDKQYQAWCKRLAEMPEDYRPKLQEGFKADLELAPMRWMRSGFELIESAKGTVPVRLINRIGTPLDTYLPYAVFQSGTEQFLKGMWLAQYQECRSIEASDYVSPEIRSKYRHQLKDLGHDLLKITEALKTVPLYAAEGNISQFLAIVSGITRRYYYPLTEEDARWANARYPRRFYDDAQHKAAADALKEYPTQWALSRLYGDTMERINRLWGITEGIAKRTREGRLS